MQRTIPNIQRYVLLWTLLIGPSYASTSTDFRFDIDQDGKVEALVDGLLVLRHLFGFSGATLSEGAVTSTSERSSAAEITSYLGETLDSNMQGNIIVEGVGVQPDVVVPVTEETIFGEGDALLEQAVSLLAATSGRRTPLARFSRISRGVICSPGLSLRSSRRTAATTGSLNIIAPR